MTDSNIVAGIVPDGNGHFGTGGNAPIPAEISSPSIISKIASVVVNGSISPGGAGPYGIVAAQINKFSLRGTSLNLQPGPGNDQINGLDESDVNLREIVAPPAP
jgi:hypothetical protein